METLSDADFDRVMTEALERVPTGVADFMDNVALFVDDDPPPDQPGLLGLYEGTPLTERDSGWDFALPDAIFLYRSSLVGYARDIDDLRDEIVITIVHEIAHHYGLDDEALHRLGWG